jgi:hypothetical protein
MAWHIRVVAALLVMSGCMPNPAQACTCGGIVSIGEALENAETVVLGRVESVRQIPSDRRDGMTLLYPDAVVVKVLEVLKGDAPDQILVSADFLCYRSFDVEDLKPGETFIFPIVQTTKHGVNALPSCSHSALKLMDAQLYTNEPTTSGDRRLEPYMKLALLRVLVPLRLVGIRGPMIWAGSLVILACLFLTRRVRRRPRVARVAEQPADPMKSLRSLRWRSGFAIAWMLLWSGVCILFGIAQWDWVPWALGVMFAFAAAGIALRWPWTEGLSYGLLLVWIGACAVLTYGAVTWRVSIDQEFNPRLYYLFAIDLVLVAGMIWCADAVRRRFSAVAA